MIVWLGLLPPVVAMAYYALNKDSGFDAALKSRCLSTGNCLWTVRVGGTSSYKSGISFHSTSFGLNGEDKKSPERAQRLANGEISGAHQATYVVFLQGTLFPKVICVFRDVAPDRTNLYEIEDLGSGPIGFYVLYIVLGSLGILILLAVATMFRTRKGMTRNSVLS